MYSLHFFERAILRAVPVFLSIIVFHTATAQTNYGNGIWWLQQNSSHKHTYIEGVIVGMNLGWNQAMKRTGETEYIGMPRAFAPKQVISKLDSLYKDPRNSKISIYYAVWTAMYILGSGSDHGMDLFMEQLRNTAR